MSLVSNAWHLEIPEAWTATVMLQNLAADYLSGPGESAGVLDDEMRQRMIGLVIMGHLELAAKVGELLKIVQQMLTVDDPTNGCP